MSPADRKGQRHLMSAGVSAERRSGTGDEWSEKIYHRHSGAMRSIEPGISRFRVWSFGPSRNDGVLDCVATSNLSTMPRRIIV
jgi:hypothetical protein